MQFIVDSVLVSETYDCVCECKCFHVAHDNADRTARDFEIDITPLTLSLPPHIQPSPPPPPPPPPRLSPSADLARLISSYPIWSGLGAIGMVWGLGQAGLAAVEKREMKLAKNKKGKTSDGYMVEAVRKYSYTKEDNLVPPADMPTNHHQSFSAPRPRLAFYYLLSCLYSQITTSFFSHFLNWIKSKRLNIV